jgi:hypothetical protein
MESLRFPGNCPRNVARDAKYSVRARGGSGPAISIAYRTNDGERFYLATSDHQELVRMVSLVKEEFGGGSLGPFYINEYRQVIVPGGPAAEYYYAGEYHRDLEFDFNGALLSGSPVNAVGQPLQPGAEWRGPHAGIRYKLKAGGGDIAYMLQTQTGGEREITLSNVVGSASALETAKRFRDQIGHAGGRFYVNEWRAMFRRVEELGEYRYIYLGQLTEDLPWFPKPRL